MGSVTTVFRRRIEYLPSGHDAVLLWSFIQYFKAGIRSFDRTSVQYCLSLDCVLIVFYDIAQISAAMDRAAMVYCRIVRTGHGRANCRAGTGIPFNCIGCGCNILHCISTNLAGIDIYSDSLFYKTHSRPVDLRGSSMAACRRVNVQTLIHRKI